MVILSITPKRWVLKVMVVVAIARRRLVTEGDLTNLSNVVVCSVVVMSIRGLIGVHLPNRA